MLLDLLSQVILSPPTGNKTLKVTLASQDDKSNIVVKISVGEEGIKTSLNPREIMADSLLLIPSLEARDVASHLKWRVIQALTQALGGNLYVKKEEEKGKVYICFIPLKIASNPTEEKMDAKKEKRARLFNTPVISLKEEPVIDWEKGAALVNGEAEDAQAFLDLFFNKNLPPEIKSITEAYEKRNIAVLKQQLHRMCSGLAYCGLPRLGKAALQFKVGLEKDEANLLSLYQTLCREVDAATQAYYLFKQFCYRTDVSLEPKKEMLDFRPPGGE